MRSMIASIRWLVYLLVLLSCVNSQKHDGFGASNLSPENKKPGDDGGFGETGSEKKDHAVDEIIEGNKLKEKDKSNKPISKSSDTGKSFVRSSEGGMDASQYSSPSGQGSSANDSDHDDEGDNHEERDDEHEDKKDKNGDIYEASEFSSSNSSNTSSNVSFHYENKWMPPVDHEKVNTEKSRSECKSWLERFGELIHGDYDAFSQSCGGGNSSSNSFVDEMVPDLAVGNFFRFSLFITLPPNWQSMGNALDEGLTAELHDTFPQYRIMTDHLEYDWGPPSESIEADIMSYKVKPAVVRKDEEQWWWQYSFKYFCYIPGTKDPVDNETGREAYDNIMNWMHSTEDRFNFIGNITNQMRGVTFHFQVHPPNPCYECEYVSPCYGLECDLSPTYAPPPAPGTESVPSIPSISPTTSNFPTSEPTRLGGKPQAVSTTGEVVLDTKVWDWRRYSGLVLLLTTVMGTICLSQTARLRNNMQARKEDWGNLATEEGVDELLRTGWTLKGSVMEIYDKKNVGYRDSDSMLIGGYEQTVPVGSEIAVSRTQSETVQDTVVGTTQS